MPFYSTKTYNEIGSCTHRQPAHKGHCKFVHGYGRSFSFKFGAHRLEPETHFVVEFGALKAVEKFLKYYFDHTFLINKDDPEIKEFKEQEEKGLIQLRILDNVSMEATAYSVGLIVNEYIRRKTEGRAFLVSCECRENQKNSAIYELDREQDDKWDKLAVEQLSGMDLIKD